MDITSFVFALIALTEEQKRVFSSQLDPIISQYSISIIEVDDCTVCSASTYDGID